MKDDDKLVALFNRVINSDDPDTRVTLGKEIANDIGRWLMCPSVLLEQLHAKLEQEVDFIGSRQSDNPLIEALRQYTLPQAQKVIWLIKAFLEVRPQMRELLNTQFHADVEQQIPE